MLFSLWQPAATPSGAVNFFSESWFQYTGTTRDRDYGIGWMDNIHPDDSEVSFFQLNLEEISLVLEPVRHEGKSKLN